MRMSKEERAILLDNLIALRPLMMSNEKIIELLGLNSSTFYLWKQGRRLPRVASILKLAEYLNVEAIDLYTKKLVVDFTYYFVENTNEKVG